MNELAIVVPTFNRADFLKNTLDSIFSEIRRYPDRKILVYVSDNCSTDNTQQVVEGYLACKIQYHRNNSNLGFDANVDISIILADSAKYVLVLSDDDILVQNSLSHYFTLIDSGVSMAYGASTFMSHDMRSVNIEFRDQSFKNLKEARTYIFKSGIEYYSTIKKIYCGISGVMFNREHYLAIDRRPFFGSQFIHVGATFKILANQNSTIGVINIPVIRYRLGPIDSSIKNQDAIMMVGLGLLNLFKQVVADYPWPVFKVLYNKELNWVRGLLVGIKAREKLDHKIKNQYLSLLLPKRNFFFIDGLIVMTPHWIFRFLYKLYKRFRYQ